MAKPIKENIKKTFAFQPPKTVNQTKSFLGLCSYYRHLIPRYAELTQPLNQLACKNVKFRWNGEHAKCFEKLQKIFFSEPFVKAPNFNETFYLCTDASKITSQHA